MARGSLLGNKEQLLPLLVRCTHCACPGHSPFQVLEELALCLWEELTTAVVSILSHSVIL